MKAILPIFILVLGLSACAPEPEPEPLPLPVDPTIDVTPGLNDREPDTCKAASFGHLIGQPVASLQAAAVGKEIRMIAPGAIITQEYNAFRINAHLDGNGNIFRLTCG